MQAADRCPECGRFAGVVIWHLPFDTQRCAATWAAKSYERMAKLERVREAGRAYHAAECRTAINDDVASRNAEELAERAFLDALKEAE